MKRDTCNSMDDIFTTSRFLFSIFYSLSVAKLSEFCDQLIYSRCLPVRNFLVKHL